MTEQRQAPTEAGSDEDVALVVGASEDGETLGVLRKRGDQLQAALARRAEEGKPLNGELVRLCPREGSPLCDVEVLYEPPQSRRSGPAQVASDRYRAGWERLFARPGGDDDAVPS